MLSAVEHSQESNESERLNAKDNNLGNTYFMTNDAQSGLVKLKEEWEHPNLHLLDPPRNVAGGKVMRSIDRFATDKVVYVSCSQKNLN